MKINVITLHRAENYGSVLQTLALQKKLEYLGHEVQILDYHPERYTNQGKLKRLRRQGKQLENPIFLLIAQLLIYPSYLRKNHVFDTFLKKYLNLSPYSFATNDEAKSMGINDADAYCTGSDQVWNSHWNECVEKALFLDFAPKGKLVFSYASSIGLSKLPQNEVEITKRLLDKYEYISVREDTGTKILHCLGRTDAVQSLDPTLLMTKEEWNAYASNKYAGKQYVLTYNLHHDPEIDKYASALGRKYEIPVWNISYNWHDIVRKGHLCWCPNVEDFLGLIKNAKFVVADSFHATVFSIVFEKSFVTITPEIASSRISSLLNMLGIGERNIRYFKDTSVMERSIDYIAVKQRLKAKMKESMDYLVKATSSVTAFTHNK